MTYYQRYFEKNEDYYSLFRPKVLAMIPRDTQRMLDVGCGQGDLGAAAKQLLGVKEVVGIEMFEAAAEVARSKLDQVIVGDVEHVTLEFPPEYFDCIVCADILEHTRDPWQVLADLRGFLRRDGVLVASIPNLRHIVPILKIVFDRFEYQSEGVLDKTHLRFFTLSTMRKMIHEAGFEIFKISTNRSNSWKFKLLNVFSLGILKEFAVYQYILAARRVGS
jgi:2-polyprenyl-3-methyl-5-hydroxy-6-metoxy-1,4-benzoquinol methylase